MSDPDGFNYGDDNDLPIAVDLETVPEDPLAIPGDVGGDNLVYRQLLQVDDDREVNCSMSVLEPYMVLRNSHIDYNNGQRNLYRNITNVTTCPERRQSKVRDTFHIMRRFDAYNCYPLLCGGKTKVVGYMKYEGNDTIRTIINYIDGLSTTSTPWINANMTFHVADGTKSGSRLSTHVSTWN
ncbi:hypothetical protein HDU99_006174 [Rhizoclosmatium hyalinum]|nr:hypothetical protein HDU99_006174 [Rhizoclosmatium hyalinum]